MKKNKFHFAIISIVLMILTGCIKNYTNYYEDVDNRGLAIFSNKGNAVMSCKINDRPWRTIDNKTFSFAGSRQYEVILGRLRTNTAFDTLFLSWRGYFLPEATVESSLTLAIRIPQSFTIANLSALQGQRLNIDTLTNGYFITNLSATGAKGNGSIYFHSCQFDSTAPNNITGKMSGLFEASFPTIQVTNGRFDHLFDEGNLSF